MESNHEFTDEQKALELGKSYDFETTTVGDKLYNVEKLLEEAERLPIQEAPVENFLGAVSEGNYYWIDAGHKKLGPYDLLKNWEEASKNPAWREHVDNIDNADLENPIWIIGLDYLVFNGMHRLTRIIRDGVPNVKYRYFETLPEEALIND